MLGYSLNKFVPKDSKCRFVVDIVNRLDLTELENDYSDQGGKAFDPAIMLATWFFAYSEGVVSTRKLEEMCRRDTHFIYVSANLRSDHTSFSRFRNRHQTLMSEYFRQNIHIAIEEKLSNFARICIDGTKLQASASPKNNYKTDSLKQAIETVEKDIADYMAESKDEDDVDNASPPSGPLSLDQTKQKQQQLYFIEKETVSQTRFPVYQSGRHLYLSRREKLIYRNTRTSQGNRLRQYYGQSCGACPIRPQCTKSRQEARVIKRDVRE